MSYELFKKTGIAADTDSLIYQFPSNLQTPPYDKASIQVIWANMTGTGDGTINIGFSMDDINFDVYSSSAVITAATPGSHTFEIDFYKYKSFKIIYTENSNTAIDITALTMTNFGQGA